MYAFEDEREKIIIMPIPIIVICVGSNPTPRTIPIRGLAPHLNRTPEPATRVQIPAAAPPSGLRSFLSFKPLFRPNRSRERDLYILERGRLIEVKHKLNYEAIEQILYEQGG